MSCVALGLTVNKTHYQPKKSHMKKPRSAIIFALIAAVLAVAGCKKNDSPNGGSNSQASVLTSKQWKMLYIQYKQSDGSWQTDTAPQSWKTVLITFKSDGTYSETKDVYSYSGTWQLLSSSQLQITNDSFFSGTWTITTLSSSSLQMVDEPGSTKYVLSH